MTTAWLTALGTGIDAAVDAPAMMRDLLLVLVLPVGLGQSIRLIRPLARLATRGKVVLGVVSQLLILGIILKAAVDVRDKLGVSELAPGPGPVLAAAALSLGVHLAALAGGLWGGRAWGFSRASRIAVAFACSQKTLPVALFLFDRYFKDGYPLAVVPIAFYHVGQLFVDTFIAETLAGRRTPGGRKESAWDERKDSGTIPEAGESPIPTTPPPAPLLAPLPAGP